VAKKKSAQKRSGEDEIPIEGQYAPIIERILFDRYVAGETAFTFARQDLATTALQLGVQAPSNLGDLLYSFRFRAALPESIQATATPGREWIIELAGRAKYRFRLARINRIVPSPNAFQIKIPDATPEIINMYAKTDEQALLAKVRYNRLIDIFLRVTAYSLQSHLRTSVPDVGQIEVDELYVAVRNTGQQFVIPIQAKGGSDQIGASQVQQDLALCRHKFPQLTPRPVAVQFLADNVIAMFELAFQDDELRVVEERHYKLVLSDQFSDEDLAAMAAASD
jgi:hypothetical protein